ncbi:MASE1 domain-containing protein [Parasphingorhabdus cellanae]|uniref:histidine kinase n=1 Tax=Parasphingorhabdus cellanae TaxID=2806553 RepID=A0ABX7T1G1_9SPHN|nr:MASE1 domain-containing protein [Parasphingorhabdus cellanae]QTD55401.1 MASE1 domain-containing protein [Parasphingorhabdus cellanae]
MKVQLRSNDLLRNLFATLMVAIVFGGLAWVSVALTRGDDSVAVVWLANAVMVAVLLRSEARKAIGFLPAAFLANIAAGLMVGDTVMHASMLSMINQFEIIVIWLAMRKIGLARPNMQSLSDLGKFSLIGGLLAPAASGLIAALYLADASTGNILSFWIQWSATDGLGMLLLGPATMMIIDSIRLKADGNAPATIRHQSHTKEWIVIQTITFLLTGFLFGIMSFPAFFLVAPMVLLSAFRLGIWGTALSIIQISIIVALCAALKLGPFYALDISLSTKLFVLQIFLLSCFAVGIPVSIVLADKSKMRGELREYKDLSDSMLQNMKEVIFRTNEEGAWVFLNPAWENLTGWSVDESIGQHVSNVLVDGEIDLLREKLSPIRSGEETQCQFEWQFQHKNRSVFDVELSLSRLTDDSGAYLGSIGNIRDISQRKAMEKNLVSARRDAEKAAHSKTRFLASMSHEIRTPMNGVLGFTQLLLESELTEEQRVQMQMIHDSGNAMMRLLNNILDISKVEAGNARSQSKPMNMRNVLRSCCDLMAPTADQKNLALHLEIDPSVPDHVIGDCSFVRQIALNLLGNSLKFTHEGAVRLKAFATPHDVDSVMVNISVQDSGIGISEDRLAAIFDPFEQARPDTAEEFGGSGLGLTISQQLAAVMGGKITVESKEGHGTTFTLQFSATIDDEQHESSPRDRSNPVAQPPVKSQKRLLLVEDHDINQVLITAMTTKMGYETILAVNGVEAVEKVDEAQASGQLFDLVLMDMQMPIMGGLEACEIIRKKGITAEQMPILAITANAYAEDIENCIAAGMQAHISKPIMIDKLKQELDRWIKPDGENKPESGDKLAAMNKDVSASKSAGMQMSNGLQQKYLDRKSELVDCLESLIQEKAYSKTDLNEAKDFLHKFVGTAAFFGEAELGDQAREIETQMLEWKAANNLERLESAMSDFLKAA